MSSDSIKNTLLHATKILEHTSTSARIDAEILLEYVINKSRTWLYTFSDYNLTLSEQQKYQALITKRLNGAPIAYLVGEREFWSLPFQVNSDTLIPRAETELLVEKTLQLLPQNTNLNILELGTGSGAIAIALAHERPNWQIFACDINPKTLNMARQNARNLKINNIIFFNSDWFSALNTTLKFNAIISNPPYLAKNDPHQHIGDLRFEPLQALVSGEDGLDALNHIIQHAQQYLTNNGILFLEHGYTQEDAVKQILLANKYQQIQCWKDLQGNPRVSCGCVGVGDNFRARARARTRARE
jgi:release factor glutamine methyltransferase